MPKNELRDRTPKIRAVLLVAARLYRMPWCYYILHLNYSVETKQILGLFKTVLKKDEPFPVGWQTAISRPIFSKLNAP